jgi:uncharacterized protein with PIN domain
MYIEFKNQSFVSVINQLKDIFFGDVNKRAKIDKKFRNSILNKYKNKCNVCKKIFPTQYSLNFHKVVVSKFCNEYSSIQDKFECAICKKIFVSGSQFSFLKPMWHNGAITETKGQKCYTHEFPRTQPR